MIGDLLLREAASTTRGSDGTGMDFFHTASLAEPYSGCQALPNDKTLGPPLHSARRGSTHETFMRTFGQRLRSAREAMGLTQEALGFEVGVSKASISAWENDRERPSFDNLPKLHVNLNESLDDLILGYREASEQAKAAQRIMEPSATYAVDNRRAQSERELSLLKRFRKLQSRKQDALLEILKPER